MALTIWLDDVRAPAEHGYGHALWFRRANTLIEFLADNFHLVEDMSLDHDLLGGSGCGMDVIDYMVISGRWPEGGVRVHSSNTEASARMTAAISRHYGRHFQETD